MVFLQTLIHKDKTSILAAQIFARAALYIRTYGWQVSGMNVNGKPRCSMGALESASQGTIYTKELSSLMYTSLYKELKGESLTEFNHRVNNGESVAQLFEKVSSILSDL